MVRLKTYKNRVMALIICILSIFVCVCFTACSSDSSTKIDQLADNENGNNEETSKTNNSQKYKEFDLSVDNFNYFFDFTSSFDIPANEEYYKVIGVLNYAYYDNVVVTFDVVYTIGSNNRYGEVEETYVGEYSVALNAAGYASFYNNDSDLLDAIGLKFNTSEDPKRQFTVKAVTGKIILF